MLSSQTNQSPCRWNGNEKEPEGQMNKMTFRFNSVSDEFVFNASDNDDTPESPMSFDNKV